MDETKYIYTDGMIKDVRGDVSIEDFTKICRYKIGSNLKQIYTSSSKYGDDVKTIKV